MVSFLKLILVSCVNCGKMVLLLKKTGVCMTREINKKGIYSALVTPLDKNGEVSYENLAQLVRYEKKSGVEGFYCCGSSGEGLLLSDEERMKVVETVAKEKGDLPLIVHTGAMSSRSSIRLSQHAEKSGAAAVSMIPPIYYKYSQEEIEANYLRVADHIHIGMIVYNIPMFTGVAFTKASPILTDERIIGIKNTSYNLYDLERMKDAYPQKLLFNGFDEIYLSSLSAGATATIGTTMNVCPRIFQKIRTCFEESRIADGQELQARANDFMEALVGTHSLYAATKYCLTQLGVDCGECREPFLPLNDAQKAVSLHALENIMQYEK